MKIKTMFKVIIGALVLSITGLVIGLYAANNNVYAGAEPEAEYTPNYLTFTAEEAGGSNKAVLEFRL